MKTNWFSMAKGNRVVVFQGGPSREHDVSLRSGAAVLANLAQSGYEGVPVTVTRNGQFVIGSSASPLDLGPALVRLAEFEPMCAFIAMHGAFGEDGRIQSLCDWMGLPYVGSGVVASAIALDKITTKAVYRDFGILTPASIVVRSAEQSTDRVRRVIDQIELPCVVKVPREGSSFGVSIVKHENELAGVLDELLAVDGVALVEAFTSGREITVSVLEDPDTGRPRALPLIEIVVKGAQFFDYSTKYDPTKADEICPAPVSAQATELLSDLGVRAHLALGLSGFSRTDFIVNETGAYALETNTIPGLTEFSLFPKAAATAGIPFWKLLDILIKRAVATSQSGAILGGK